MIRLGKIIAVVVLLLNMHQIFSSVRGDLVDRSPDEAIRISKIYGASESPTETVSPAIQAVINASKSAVWICVGNRLMTGVLLDPYTVLTCAQDVDLASTVKVSNLGTFDTTKKSSVNSLITVKEVIVFPGFKKLETKRYLVSLNSREEHVLLDSSGKSLCSFSNFKDLSYDQLHAKIPCCFFEGVDLAVLKLSSPLRTTYYPPLSSSYANGYGIAVGYGPQSFNNPDGAVSLPAAPSYSRHVISCKITDQDIARSIVYASYSGKVGCGDESFIPQKAMKKTEGLPVDGDSGGPFFVDVDGGYCLAGICSRTITPISDVIPDLKRLDVVQPIFPTWTDLSTPAIQKWIRANMGETSTTKRPAVAAPETNE